MALRTFLGMPVDRSVVGGGPESARLGALGLRLCGVGRELREVEPQVV